MTLATSSSRSDAPSERQSPECWPAPLLPAGARRLPGFGHLADTQASPRIRRPLRRRFAASLETQREIGFYGRRGSLIASNLRLGATGGRLLEPRRLPAVGDRTSARRPQSVACVRVDPTAACLSAKQPECRDRSAPGRGAIPVLCTFRLLSNFKLCAFRFLGGLSCAH